METPPMADWLEGFVAMKMHALIRFGWWADIIAAPLPADPDLYCVTTAMIRYAKGVACGHRADRRGGRAQQAVRGRRRAGAGHSRPRAGPHQRSHTAGQRECILRPCNEKA